MATGDTGEAPYVSSAGIVSMCRRKSHDETMSEDGPGGHGRRGWLLGVVVLVIVAVCSWLLGQRVQSPSQAASRAAPPEPSWITARVERRVLAQTLISRGDVRPQVAVSVEVPTSIEGPPVVTAIAVKSGDSVSEGVRLMEVSGRPVFVLQGSTPVYRSLRPQMTGSDVAQLQAGLGRLGCDTAFDGGVFGAATKTCVAALYSDAGYEPMSTSETELVDLVAAEQALADAEVAADSAQLALDNALRGPTDTEILAADIAVSAAWRGYDDALGATEAANVQAEADSTQLQIALDELRNSPDATQPEVAAAQGNLDAAIAAVEATRRAGASAIATAAEGANLAEAAREDMNEDRDVTVESTALVQALDVRDRAGAALELLRASTGPIVPQGEIVFAPSLPARVQQIVSSLGPIAGAGPNDSGAGAGAGASASSQLATLAAGDLIVSMTVPTSDRDSVRVGMEVELLEEQSNGTYPATISAIADSPTFGTDGPSGYPIVISPIERLPEALTGLNVRVTVKAASTETATLVVPIAAVSSVADGTANVSIISGNAADGGDPVVVAVIAGLSADGFVSVVPATTGALHEGDRVVVGR